MNSKIKIHVDCTSFMIPILLVLEGHLTDVLALLISAAMHECGHLLAARLLHLPLSSLRVSLLGAQLQLRDPLLSYKKEWILCAAGPLFSTLFSLVAYLISIVRPDPLLFEKLADASFALGLINLLPIGWLDGGRMFRAVCQLLFSPAVARIIARTVSFLCFLFLWMISVYLILRMGRSLSLFIFSFSIFIRFFLADGE